MDNSESMKNFDRSVADYLFGITMENITSLINNSHVIESKEDLQLFRDIRDLMEKTTLMEYWINAK